jgi:hypothetical protein
MKEANNTYSAVHQTIIVSPDGNILQNWVGAYTEVRQVEVEGFFGVNLPGLTAEK